MEKILFVLLFAFATLAQAQQGPTGLGSQSISQYWSRTGNQSTGSTPTSANIFGTATGFNSPIYTITDGVVRTRLNGTLNQTINGVLQNVSGNFGIGRGGFFDSRVPATLLHLAGTGSTSTIAGWRPWMQSGMFIQEGSDAMYIGMQYLNSQRVDAVINWSDDQSGSGGPDKLKFVFTGAKLNNNVNNNRLDGLSTYGYEFMQLTSFPDITNSAGFPVGYVGIGPVFTSTLPQSRLHINSEDNLDTWLQITNQTGTEQTQTDGLRFGITSDGTVQIRQQEVLPTIFFNAYNSTPGVSHESVRIMATTAGGRMGVGGRTGNLYYGNSANPTQTLEVNSTATAVGPTNSGLRFTDLNSSATPLTNNPNVGFLTVNSTGDVIYMAQNQQSGGILNANNGCSVINNNVVLGNNTGSTLAQLNNNREIPMNGNNVLFTQTGRIGIGDVFTGGANNPISKLDIHSDTDNPLALHVRSDNAITAGNYTMSEFNNYSTNGGTTTTIDVLNNGNADKRSIGINVLVQNTTTWTEGENVGIISNAENAKKYNTGGGFYAKGEIAFNNTGIGGYGYQSERFNFGGVFRAGNPDYISGGYNGIQNIGVYAESWGAEDCYGIFAKATGGSNLNYGIYAEALPALNPFGPNLAGYFNGHVLATGDINSISDSILKENITGIPNAINIISNIQPHKYNFKTNDFNHINLPEGNQYGLIAQEIEPILPELVSKAVHPAKYDSLGNVSIPSLEYKTLNYIGFIPILIQAVQEINTKNDSAILVLNNRVDSLENIIASFESRFEELSNQIDDCCKNGHGNGHGHGNNKSNSDDSQTYQPTIIQIDLEYSDAIILEQNVPNPFAEKTTINYTIPEEISFAQIIFSNNYGKIIKTVDITAPGQGSIVVYASNLSSGIYNYSLIIDGKIIETKKMVCTK